jgi:serine/threonine protein kinase
MSPTPRWHRIGEIYHSAVPLSRSERAAYVTSACSGDSELQEEVESLLHADDSSGGFLEAAVFDLGLKILSDDGLTSDETEATSENRGPDELLGKTLDERYLIERQLGQGGVGKVYLARDLKLHNKHVVIKVLLEKSLKNEWVALKFRQEKEALARIDHPGVVGIVDTGELADGEPYIVMQYIDGISLRDAIKAQPEGIELERAASIIKQIGAALSAVHEKKIYHRDLKPENIMLQRLGRGEEQVKILDFGVAKVKESLIASSTMTGAMSAGTVFYMSPEQLRLHKASAVSDIYSLGVIAYEMVTGRRPFKAQTATHLAEMQRQGIRVKPADLCPLLSQEAEEIILRALAFEPQARYQNAAEFGDALSRALVNDEETVRQGLNPVPLPPTVVSVDPVLPSPATTPQTDKTIVTPFEPAQPHTFQQPVSHVEPEPLKKRWPLVVGGLVVIAALGLGAYWIISKRQSLFGNVTKTGPVNPASPRSLVYSLTVQKMRDGKPYKEPFESSGQEVFENGYKFRFNVSSPQSGYLYVFNEGAPEKDKTDFTIIYPTPLTNKGSAKLDPNQTVQTNWNAFAGETGTEHFWIVWSATAVTQLESARDEAFKNKEGAITDAAMVRNVKDFFAKHSDPKLETTKDTVKQQTDVRASGDLLVKQLELEHR